MHSKKFTSIVQTNPEKFDMKTEEKLFVINLTMKKICQI